MRFHDVIRSWGGPHPQPLSSEERGARPILAPGAARFHPGPPLVGEGGQRPGEVCAAPLRALCGFGGVQHFEGIAGGDDVQPRVVGAALEARLDGQPPAERERPHGERAHARMSPPELDRLRGIEREMPRAGAIGGATARAGDDDAVDQDGRGNLVVGLPAGNAPRHATFRAVWRRASQHTPVEIA